MRNNDPLSPWGNTVADKKTREEEEKEQKRHEEEVRVFYCHAEKEGDEESEDSGNSKTQI